MLEGHGVSLFWNAQSIETLLPSGKRNPAAAITASMKKAGSRLYNHFALDHKALFQKAVAVKGDVLLTYDHAEEIVKLAREVGLETRLVAMKNTHHAENE